MSISFSTEPCQEDSFQCENGECIPSVNLCDGHPHCTDGSDEAQCGMSDTDETSVLLVLPLHLDSKNGKGGLIVFIRTVFMVEM